MRSGAPSDPRDTPRAIDPAIEAARAFFHERRDVHLALVFGSRATGRGTSRSDLDIAVVAPGADLFRIAGDLSSAARVEVDLLDLADAGVPLLARIVREGVVIHEARRGAAAQWRAHALADLATDLPWYRRMRDAWLGHLATKG